MSNAVLEIDGVELAPVPDEPNTYAYRPLRATVARDAADRPQFTLIEAGPVAMLGLTAMWGVSGPHLERVRSVLAARTGVADSDVVLRPASVEVGPVSLLLADAAGELAPLQTRDSSGVPPYDTAFQVTLAPEQLASVKKAMHGERGLFALRLDVTDQVRRTPSRRTVQTWSASSTTRSSTPAGSTSREQSVNQTTEKDVLPNTPIPPTPVTRRYETDAVDWGIDFQA